MSTQPNTPTTGPGTLTDKIYRASLDPARLALICGALTGPFAGVPYAWLADPTVDLYIAQGSDLVLSDGTQIKTNAVIQYGHATQAAGGTLLLAAQATGLPIDLDCMMRGWTAPGMMQDRVEQGWAWVPSYGMPNVTSPGVLVPGEPTNYTTAMPPGGIKVSTDAADYPPYVVPGSAGPGTPVVWTPDLSVMLSWTDNPTLVAGVMTPGKTHYFFGVMPGQNPALGTPCTYQGSSFVCAQYPNGEAIGGAVKMWLLTGSAA